MNDTFLTYVDDEHTLHKAVVVGNGTDDEIFAYLPGKRMVCELAKWNLQFDPAWACPRFREHNGMCSLAELDDDERAKRFFEDAVDPLQMRSFARATALILTGP
jgi:hypothetical protein